MSGTKALFLFCTFTASGFCQTYLGADFDQLAAPSGCVRNATTSPTASPAIPALKLPGITISGGQTLIYANPYQTYNNVYATISTCAGVQPAITITFDGPVSGLNLVVGNNWSGGESLQVADDAGGSQTVALGLFNNGQSVFFTNNNIRKVTLTLTGQPWTPTSPSGFYIDNISCYLNEAVYFIDPVPDLMSGAGVIADPESLATQGTMVRGVAADGLARVLLTAPTSHVGDIVTFSVLNDKGVASNSSQQDGGISSIGGSSNGSSQSVRIAAQDSSNGPMAFALYYPPPDFSRGSQDDALASRTVGIQVNSSTPNTPAVTRLLSIVRPPVVLIHDLWGDPADWNAFTPLLNDSRFFIRRASYNAVLGSRIAGSLPAVQTANIALAKENSLGLAYNAPLLLAELEQFVNEFRAANNVAAAQADVVVHGMGGDIARALVQLANYEAPESYSQGNVNKLITIGTPHLGTPLSTQLLRNDNACFREILADAGNFSFTTAAVDGSNVSGGIGDLQGDGTGGGLSPALAQIQQRSDDNAPTALIAGIANNSNTSGLDKTLGVAQFIRQSCPGSPLAASLTSSDWGSVFGDFSDGMVPLLSQLAGQVFGQAANPLTGLIHSDGMGQLGFNPPDELDASTPVASTVIGLLNTQARSNAFQLLP